jgi:hypothetical protein
MAIGLDGLALDRGGHAGSRRGPDLPADRHFIAASIFQIAVSRHPD